MEQPEELLDRFLTRGDEDAMAIFVQRTRGPLLRAARRIVGDADAEDAVQTAYHSLLRRGEVPRPRVVAWLMTATVRIAYRHRAKQLNELEVARRLAVERPPEAEREDLALLRSEVDRLPAGYRDVVVLHYFEGLTAAEAGRLLGLKEPAVRQRLVRARALLRSRLSPRMKHTLLLGPWWLADHAAAAFALGGAMTGKKALAATLLLLSLLAGGIVWRLRDERPPADRAVVSAPRAGLPDESALGAEGDGTEAREEQRLPFASGTVTDGTMAPMEGVLVILRGTEQSGNHRQPAWIVPADVPASAVCVTGPDGKFAVEEPVPDLHAIAFFKGGYAARQVKDLSEDRARNQDLRVLLEGGRSFEGTVNDTAGRPIPLAQIAAFAADLDAGVSQYAYAGHDGRFVFRTLSQPYSMVVAGCPGYAYKVLQGAELGARADLVLERDGLVVDVADDADGSPVPEPNATLQREGPVYVYVATRPRAPFIVPGRVVLPSVWVVRLKEQEAVDAALHVFAPGYRTRVLHLRLARAEEPPHLIVRLTPGEEPPTVAGRVRGAASATLELRAGPAEGFGMEPDEQLPLLFRLKDVTGRFAFPAVPPGRYRLVASAPGCAQLGMDVEPPATDLAVRLDAAAVLEVLTRDAAGAPLPGQPVHVECEVSPARCWNAVSGDDGIARFEGLPAGPARAAPVHGEYAPFPWSHMVHVSVDLVAGRAVRTELGIPVRRRFAILVRDDTGLSYGDLPLSIEAQRGHAVHGKEYDRLRGLALRTDASGRAEVDLYPGEYEVAFRIGETRSERRFEVPDRDGASHDVVVLARGARVRGRVVERGTGEPVTRRPVYASFADPSRVRGWLGSSVTDDEGRYEITGLPEGDLHITAAARSDADGAYDRESPYPRAKRAVSLRAGEQRTADFKLPRVRGEDAEEPAVPFVAVVRDAATGAPLAGAHAFAEGWIEESWIDAGQVETDGKGRGEGKLLRAERYRVWVHGPAMRHEPAGAEPTLADGVLSVDVALRPRPK